MKPITIPPHARPIAYLVMASLLLTACDSKRQPFSPPQAPPQQKVEPMATDDHPKAPLETPPHSSKKAKASPDAQEIAAQIALQRDAVSSHPHRLLLPASAEVEDCPKLPFYQALPFAKGELKARGPISVRVGGEDLPAIVTPLAYWSDGSIRWLGVDGMLSRDLLQRHSLPTSEAAFSRAISLNMILNSGPGATASTHYTPPKPSVDPVSGMIHWDSTTHGRMFSLAPAASVAKVTIPKAKQEQDPVSLDTKGQFSWAEELGNLSADKAPVAVLTPKILKTNVEADTPLYTIYRFIGLGGQDSLGKQLEWMLRAKVYKRYPLLRLSMTWMPRWNPEQHALASAQWNIVTPQTWSDIATLGGEEPRTTKSLLIATSENGSHTVTGDSGTREIAAPTLDHDGLVMAASAASPKRLAIAIPDFTKYGPGHLKAAGNTIEIASWSELSRKALDLRQSGEKDAFGINEVDQDSNGSGLSHTLEASLIFADAPAESRALAKYEAAKDSLWFTSAADIERTGAMGPFNLAILANEPEHVRALHANLLFLVRARDYWKWYGFATYGDYRTNFALGNDIKRGLHAGHWALNGRYGWRNASGSINYGLMRAGLALNDRELLLAGILNARHVADIDTKHPSFFSPAKEDEGGMHRRNRDHWSGNAQVQYSPTKGIYIAKWLSNDVRLEDVLAETRDYVSREGGKTSAFAAQAWIMRFTETHSPSDYAKARQLLDKNAAWWKETAKAENLQGYAALYANNFRRISDGLETLIQFFESTDDTRYLQAIKESVVAHGLPNDFNGSPGVPYSLAYLLAHGIPENEVGQPLLQGAKALIRQMKPNALPDPTGCTYEELIKITTTQLPPHGSPAFRESASIAGRATYGFLALQYLGEENANTNTNGH